MKPAIGRKKTGPRSQPPRPASTDRHRQPVVPAQAGPASTAQRALMDGPPVDPRADLRGDPRYVHHPLTASLHRRRDRPGRRRVSMAFSEGLSDTGDLTDRGSLLVRVAITGGGTFAAWASSHALPFLIPDYGAALSVAIIVVALELLTLAYLRHKRLRTGFARSFVAGRRRRRDHRLAQRRGTWASSRRAEHSQPSKRHTPTALVTTRRKISCANLASHRPPSSGLHRHAADQDLDIRRLGHRRRRLGLRLGQPGRRRVHRRHQARGGTQGSTGSTPPKPSTGSGTRRDRGGRRWPLPPLRSRGPAPLRLRPRAAWPGTRPTDHRGVPCRSGALTGPASGREVEASSPRRLRG